MGELRTPGRRPLSHGRQLLCLACLMGTAAWSQQPQLTVQALPGSQQPQLVLDSTPDSVPIGGMSSGFVIASYFPDGGPAPVPMTLTGALWSSSDAGLFSAINDVFYAWHSSIAFQMDAGSYLTGPFYYSDTQLMPVTFFADAGPGYSGTSDPIPIDPMTVQDDFENDSVDLSQSPWNDVRNATGVSLQVTPLAAHRGSAGVRITDTDSQVGLAQQGAVSFLFPSVGSPTYAYVTGPYYTRAWIRVNQTQDAGNPQLLQNGNLGLGLDPDTGTLLLQDANGTSYPLLTRGVLGAWHLLELEMVGASGKDGGARVWLDTQLLGGASGLDLDQHGGSGTTYFTSAGELYDTSGGWTGTIDLDDVRSGALPPASLLAVDAGGPSIGPGCSPISVYLRTSTHDLAEAPYGVAAQLADDGGVGQFFSDPACTQGTVTAFIAARQTQTVVYYRASSSGPASLSASQPDFFTETLPVQALAGDGGLPPIKLVADLGCHCHGASGGGLSALLFGLPALLAGLRRRSGG